jgi:Tol biopolymer transport system component
MGKRWIFTLFCILLFITFKSEDAAAAQSSLTIERVTVAPDGTPANNFSIEPRISGDGNVVSFLSWASNLVEGDTNNVGDVFVRDLTTQETERVSVASDGTQANGDSYNSWLSRDGRYVVFRSKASNLVEGDDNELEDIFIHHRDTHQTTRIDMTAAGVEDNLGCEGPSISDNGRYISFACTPFRKKLGGHIYRYDQETGNIEVITQLSDGTLANSPAYVSSVSDNGDVLFASGATNLTADDINEMGDIFLYRHETADIVRYPMAPDGSETNGHSGSPAITQFRNFLAFSSLATNLVETAADFSQVYVIEEVTGEISRVSVSSDGTPGDDSSGFPDISADGRYIVFDSFASNLIDDPYSGSTAVIYRHDRQTGETIRVSESITGGYPNDTASTPMISDDGHTIVFESDATNLVEGDSNDNPDIFVVHLLEG